MTQGQGTIPFGLHLMLDMYNCSPASLNDKSLVLTLLDTLPERLGMKKLTSPVVVFTEGNNIKDPGGWSGFVMIQESHISIHTFIKRRFVSIDVYSCKQFNTALTIDFFKHTFHTHDVDTSIEVRGKKYPAKDID